MTTYIHSHTINSVTTNNNFNYEISIEPYLPDDHDLVHVIIGDDIDDAIERIELHIGTQRILNLFDKFHDNFDDVKNKNLLENPLPLSLVDYMIKKFVFVLDRNILEQRERFEWDDECVDELTYSDTETEFFDGVNVQYGRHVYRKSVQTGNKVKNIIDNAIVKIPSIILQHEPSLHDKSKDHTTCVDIIQNIIVDISNTKFVESLKASPNLLGWGKRVDNSDQNIWCRVKNTIIFQNGIAGLKYCYQ